MDARYRRWDGSQDPFADHLDIGDLLEQLSDDLLTGFGGRSALRRLQREGFGRTSGLDDIMRRARAARREVASRADPGGALREVLDELDDIVAEERAALADRDDPDARLAELELDTLPRDPAGRIRGLRDHDFASPSAARRFRDLEQRLRREVLDAYLKDLTGALESVTEEDVTALTEMLADLNAMLEARARGEEIDFEGFMRRHGHLFPEQPETLDELLEVLARRMAAMSQLLASMSPEQRRELLELARSVFDDLDLEFQLSQLGEHLRGVLPQLDWDQPVEGLEPGGSGPLSGIVDDLQQLGELDQLIESMDLAHAGATIEDVDEESLRRHLGEDAVRDLRRLKRIERELEEAGVMRRRDGEIELTPRGARVLGERALTRLLERVRREPADRTIGADPEPTGQTRPWRFGDRERLSTRRTVLNAVQRTVADHGPDAVRRGVHLAREDLEVEEVEVRPRTATALLLDLSFSMPLQGHFVPAKRMALALHALITGKHRQDSLHLVGFSDYARRLQPADLAAAGFERVYGTNMQHAFLLARRLLADDPRPIKQVIMVTDGEPTAHLDGDQSVFNWPPIPETLERTLREAMRLARMQVSINIFLLEDAPGLVAFAERLAELTEGQVFRMDAEQVGRHVVGGYA